MGSLSPVLALGIVLAMGAFAADPCAEKGDAACEASRKSRCNQAVEFAISQARDLPTKGATEERRKRELVEKVESTVADHRRRGEDPCRTWTAVMGIAFTQ